ncbi:hypothetical protein [Sulfolobus sp. E11-6]|uniref:hypothetical protein n=1 Tax=Sulfolobus sp. E11-6 TaxID=2663020 RepID=UPI0012973CFA|nr:hypothetical protein [Sulfolobus sp. E11-6]QGA69093.1 hypothetical protein GFS33_10620 [Sulfolobus sp. E11-6]
MDIFQLQGLFLLLSAILGYFLHNKLSVKIVSFVNNYINLPTIFFITYLQRGFEVSDAKIFLASVLYNFLMLAIVLYLTRDISPFVRGAVLINSIFMNTINLPFSILLVFRGNYEISATVAVAMATLRLPIAMIVFTYLNKGKSLVPNGLMTNLSRYLPVIAFLVGSGLHYVIGSILSENDVNTINLILILIVLYEFGYQIKRVIGEMKIENVISKPYIIIYISRLAISPILIFFILLVLGLTSKAIIEQVMVTGMMAPAITNVIWARIYGFDVETTVRSTLILTPIAVIVVIIFLLLY